MNLEILVIFFLITTFRNFANKVWILIGIAAVAVVLYLKITQRENLFHRRQIESDKKERKKNRNGNNRESIVLYVVGILVAQGISTEISYNDKYSKEVILYKSNNLSNRAALFS